MIELQWLLTFILYIYFPRLDDNFPEVLSPSAKSIILKFVSSFTLSFLIFQSFLVLYVVRIVSVSFPLKKLLFFHFIPCFCFWISKGEPAMYTFATSIFFGLILKNKMAVIADFRLLFFNFLTLLLLMCYIHSF